MLCFDDYRLDLHRRLLFEKNTVVRVPAKVLEIIAFLAGRPERIVTKDELAKELWPGMEIGDSNIGQHVYLARKALRDLTKPHRYIATAHGVGYCFTGDVRLHKVDGQAPSLQRSSNSSLEALHLYKSGRYFADLRTRAGLESSIEFFDRAIELQPDFARAYAGRAFSHLLTATSYYANPREHFAAATRNARESELLDAREAMPAVILAAVALLAQCDTTACGEWLDEAFALRTDFVPAHVVAFWHAIVSNDLRRATASAERLVQLRGARGGADAYLGIAQYFAGNYDVAAAGLRDAVALNPHVMHVRLFFAMSLLRIGKLDEALRSLREVAGSDGYSNGAGPDLRAHAYAYQAWCAASARHDAEVRNAVARLESLRTRFVSPVARAIAAAAIGDERQVAFNLREAAELQDPWFTFTSYIPELS